MLSKISFALALLLLVGNVSAVTVCPKYVVAPGDSLYSIAQKFKILPDGLIAALQACNQPAELLQIGQEICLPGAELPGCGNVQSFNDNVNCKVYIVQQGDTISSVAASLDIYNVELQNLNNDVTQTGILKPNTYLRLPSWASSCGDPNKSGASCRVYVVQSGDFMSGIANAFRVDVNELLSVNPGLSADSVLQNGQPIKVPPFPSSCGAGTPTKPPTDTVLKCRGYRVFQGDDIAAIAQKFRTTVSEILAINPDVTGGSLVQPGSIVKIPPYDDSCTQPTLVTDGGSSPPATPSPAGPIITVVPPTSAPKPIAVPSPVAPAPTVVVAPVPAPVVLAPVPAPVQAPVLAPVAPVEIPVITTQTPAPSPASSGVSSSIKVAVTLVVAVAMMI